MLSLSVLTLETMVMCSHCQCCQETTSQHDLVSASVSFALTTLFYDADVDHFAKTLHLNLP